MNPEAVYRLREVSMHYGGSPVLREINLDLYAGQSVAIVGPNGAGKSTLLQILAGLLSGFEGSCQLWGREVRQWRRKDLARKVAVIAQSLAMEFPFTVEQMVAMGRHPHGQGLFESAEDWAAVEETMRLTDCLDLRHRDFRSLSGGERQRVILASALSQRPEILLLDEPTTWLDLRHQVEIHQVLAGLGRQGLLVVMVTHDLNLAAGFADRILMLHEGRLAADGGPHEIFTAERLASVFHVSARVQTEAGGAPWIVYGR